MRLAADAHVAILKQMWIMPLLLRTGASLGFAYTFFLLWVAAGLAGVVGLALILYGGRELLRGGARQPSRARPLLRRGPWRRP